MKTAKARPPRPTATEAPATYLAGEHSGSPALWQVRAFERQQVVSAAERYHWDNRHRGPPGLVVFQYTLAGSMTVEHAGRRVVVPAGHAALFQYPEASSYGTEEGEHYECRYLTLSGAGLAEHWRDLVELSGPALALAEDGAVLRACDAVCAAAPGDDPVVVAEAVQRFVLLLYADARRQRLDDLAPAERAVERMVSMPHHPWSLKELAREHGCSREHLVRTFRARVGEPPASWLRRQRTARARDLLRVTSLPIAEVARQAGFGSAHTLARCIRESDGCGPQELRARFNP